MDATLALSTPAKRSVPAPLPLACMSSNLRTVYARFVLTLGCVALISCQDT